MRCTPPAGSLALQAFLAILQLLQKGNPLLLVQQYGELYRLLVAEDCSSWQDYLLDQASRSFSSMLAACCKRPRHRCTTATIACPPARLPAAS